jgi:hypothetical protein
MRSTRGGGGAKPTDIPMTARANAGGAASAPKAKAAAIANGNANFINGSSPNDRHAAIGDLEKRAEAACVDSASRGFTSDLHLQQAAAAARSAML